MSNAKAPQFTPLRNLEQAYRYWWLIACLGIVGGLIGWLMHSAQSPVYISSTEFSVTIDLARTGPLDERDHDRLVQAFGAVFYAQDIIDETLQRATAEGVQMDTPTFLNVSYQEWRISVWEYSIRHPDPATAQTLATLWAEVATEKITASLDKAQEAQSIQDHIDALLTCKDEIAAAEDALVVECTLPLFDDIDQEIAELDAAYAQALQLSRSLTPSLSFQQIKEADLPVEPSTNGRATFIFFGAMSGLLIGIWIVNHPRLAEIQFSS